MQNWGIEFVSFRTKRIEFREVRHVQISAEGLGLRAHGLWVNLYRSLDNHEIAWDLVCTALKPYKSIEKTGDPEWIDAYFGAKE